MSNFPTKLKAALDTKFGKDSFEIRRSEAVGPKVGKDLRQKAMLAVLCSCIGMLIYMWFRFEFRFGLGAVLGLVHDVLITLTFLSLTNTPIDLTVVAALLTIVGYSVNDTIIICDRIRENMPKMTSDEVHRYHQCERQPDPEPHDPDRRHRVSGNPCPVPVRRRRHS